MRAAFVGLAAFAVLALASRRSSVSEKAMNAKTLNQADPRWANLLVGNSNATYRVIGCVVTAMCVAMNTLKAARDPNAKALLPDMLMPSRGLLSASDYEGGAIRSDQAFAKLGFTTRDRVRNVARTAANIAMMRALIDATLAGGGVALLRVDYDLSTPADNHTVTCFARFGDSMTSRRYFAVDPAGGVTIEFNADLLCQRTSGKLYSVVGVQPVFLM